MNNRNPNKDGNNKKKSTKPPSLFLDLQAYHRFRRLTSPGSSFRSSDSSSRVSFSYDDGAAVEENSGGPKEWTRARLHAARSSDLVNMKRELSEIAEGAKIRDEVARLRKFHTFKGHVDALVKLKGLDIKTIKRSYSV